MKTGLALFFASWFFCSGLAVAETKEFARFRGDLPEGWSENEAKGITLLISPENRCVVTIALRPSEGMSAREFAQSLSEPLEGAPPDKEDNLETYAFPATVGGVQTYTRVRVYEDSALIFSVAGEKALCKDTAEGIWQSLDSDDVTLRPLFQKQQ